MRLSLGGTHWTYSSWNDAISIVAPTIGADAMAVR
jgi:hypothetical protein